MKDFTDKLKKHINYRLDNSKIKITDLVLEELISFALEDSNYNHLYESGSHKKGGDISTDDETYSIKSAQLKNGKMSISSFRLTRFKDNLPEMMYFIDNDGKNFDKYFVLARNESDTSINYSFYIIPSNTISALSMKWTETKDKEGKVTGWQTINNDDIKLKIVKSMSSQLWIEIKTDYIKEYLSFEISKNISELGKNRFIA